ncbi:unnamed protein product [Lactuca virosa]|uniref:Translocase of chloroplast 159/132 membrane anchor domain-containing protein n=1 Tax=Lactuca virosa TaxID=75947 RepID=A0AAU9LJ73_9ASTR|nr:unnamed protein product [Lactuca virosa]
MDWHGDLAIGWNGQTQIPIGRFTNLIGRVNLNNKGSGQVSVRLNSSEQLQIALVAFVPVICKLLGSVELVYTTEVQSLDERNIGLIVGIIAEKRSSNSDVDDLDFFDEGWKRKRWQLKRGIKKRINKEERDKYICCFESRTPSIELSYVHQFPSFSLSTFGIGMPLHESRDQVNNNSSIVSLIFSNPFLFYTLSTSNPNTIHDAFHSIICSNDSRSIM